MKTPEHREIKHNDHVCVEMLMGVPDERRTGRIVQIRKGVGAFGTDLYLIRLRDGSLASFENVLIRKADDWRFEDAFYCSNGVTPPVIPFQPVHPDDSPGSEYTIEGKFPEVGFLIESPKQPASEVQSFAMAIRSS